VGQLVNRGGKQYYKGDDGKLYANFRDANLSSSPADQVVRGIGQGFGYVGGVLKDVLSAQGRPSFLGGRSAAAAVGEGDPTLSRYGTPGTQTDDYNAWRGGGGAPPPPVLPAPITSPNTTFQNADDEYNRLKSQFGGPAGVEQLAMQTSLPVSFTPTGAKVPASLKDFYSAESQVGRRDMGSIIDQMGYKGDMAKWAAANPMLAQREYAKKFSADQAAAAYGGTGPNDDAIRAAISGGKFYPSEGSPSPVTNPPDFGTPANAVPAPPMQQGRAVSEPYDKAQAMAAQKTAGATGMPNFETTPEAQAPGKDFLGRVLSSPWGQALLNTGGAMATDYIQGIR